MTLSTLWKRRGVSNQFIVHILLHKYPSVTLCEAFDSEDFFKEHREQYYSSTWWDNDKLVVEVKKYQQPISCKNCENIYYKPHVILKVEVMDVAR